MYVKHDRVYYVFELYNVRDICRVRTKASQVLKWNEYIDLNKRVDGWKRAKQDRCYLLLSCDSLATDNFLYTWSKQIKTLIFLTYVSTLEKFMPVSSSCATAVLIESMTSIFPRVRASSMGVLSWLYIYIDNVGKFYRRTKIIVIVFELNLTLLIREHNTYLFNRLTSAPDKINFFTT